MTSLAALRGDDDAYDIPEWEFQDRLSRSLRKVGLSVGDLAEILDVSTNTVGRWTNGHTMPNKATRFILSTLTGVDLHWLETGEAPTPSGPHCVHGPSCTLRGCRDSNPEPSVLEPVHLTLVPERNTVRATLTPNRATVGQPILRLVEGF